MKAELIDYMGSDLRIVDAARVSFNKASEWENESSIELLDYEPKLKESDVKLINYLAKHDHFTPFTHCMITLRETVPIFVARQRFKHTVGFTYNEVSRRYVDDQPEFYDPDEWRSRPEGSVKQGSGGTIDKIPSTYLHNRPASIKGIYKDVIGDCLEVYDDMIKGGVAPEMARMVLPQSMMTSYYVTGSLSAFARAYLLRIDPHSQQEIQELAKQWDAIIKPLFPVSWEALTCN